MIKNRPANVPQLCANPALHARVCVACTLIFPGAFVSCVNKGAVVLIPKLKVASSILVARSITSSMELR